MIWSILTEYVKNYNLAQRFTYDATKKYFLLTLFNPEESP